ncbi:MAG: DUF484 family protein [Pseudomonadota bacterium]
MSTAAMMSDEVRERILAAPDVILEDPAVMRALVAANERVLGSNIVDLRGIAMERLEARLDRLEETHRSVIAAAYDNIASTNQVHRATLRLLDPPEFENFLACLGAEVAEILRVDTARLVLESAVAEEDAALQRVAGVLYVAEEGFVANYLSRGRDTAVRAVTLRSVGEGQGQLYGNAGAYIGSEACIRLDLGGERLPGMIALGAGDPQRFLPNHGTDLLAFFGGVLERALRRWLA